MRDRVGSLLPRGSDKPTVSTFHSFAVRLLRQYAKRLGFDKRFSILDSSEHLALIREAAVSALVDVQKFKPPFLAERVGRVKELLDDMGRDSLEDFEKIPEDEKPTK